MMCRLLRTLSRFSLVLVTDCETQTVMKPLLLELEHSYTSLIYTRQLASHCTIFSLLNPNQLHTLTQRTRMCQPLHPDLQVSMPHNSHLFQNQQHNNPSPYMYDPTIYLLDASGARCTTPTPPKPPRCKTTPPARQLTAHPIGNRCREPGFIAVSKG
jgi:hypothetical protein